MKKGLAPPFFHALAKEKAQGLQSLRLCLSTTQLKRS